MRAITRGAQCLKEWRHFCWIYHSCQVPWRALWRNMLVMMMTATTNQRRKCRLPSHRSRGRVLTWRPLLLCRMIVDICFVDGPSQFLLVTEVRRGNILAAGMRLLIHQLLARFWLGQLCSVLRSPNQMTAQQHRILLLLLLLLLTSYVGD